MLSLNCLNKITRYKTVIRIPGCQFFRQGSHALFYENLRLIIFYHNISTSSGKYTHYVFLHVARVKTYLQGSSFGV